MPSFAAPSVDSSRATSAKLGWLRPTPDMIAPSDAWSARISSADCSSESARPRRSDSSPGRFVACAAGFFDPAVYQPGREITIVGALHGTTAGRVGDYDYTFPRIDAATVHLWPDREPDEVGPVWWPMIGISVGGSF